MLNLHFLLKRKADISCSRNISNIKKLEQIKKIDNLIYKKYHISSGKPLTTYKKQIESIFNHVFPYYHTLKSALDSFGYEYDISLNYNKSYDYTSISSTALNELLINNNDNKYLHSFLSPYKLYNLYVYSPELNVQIKFPKIEIVNKFNYKHIINDMFVKINFNQDCSKIKLLGTRTTYSPLEYRNGYIHSHLPSSVDISGQHHYKEFCLGTGTEIQFAEIMVKEGVENNVHNLDELFLFYLNQIKAFLAYESLEGGPYIKIQNIKFDSRYDQTDIDYNLLEKFSLMFLDKYKFKKGYNELTDIYSLFTVYLINGQVNIDRNEFDAIMFNSDTIKSMTLPSEFHLLFCEHIYNNQALDYSDVLNNEKMTLNENYMLFKNQFEKLKIEPVNNSLIDQSEIKVGLKQIFKNYVYHKIKQTIGSLQ